MTSHSILELAWIGKENRPKLEPRILLEGLEKLHYNTLHRVTDHDMFDNRLILWNNESSSWSSAHHLNAVERVDS